MRDDYEKRKDDHRARKSCPTGKADMRSTESRAARICRLQRQTRCLGASVKNEITNFSVVVVVVKVIVLFIKHPLRYLAYLVAVPSSIFSRHEPQASRRDSSPDWQRSCLSHFSDGPCRLNDSVLDTASLLSNMIYRTGIEYFVCYRCRCTFKSAILFCLQLSPFRLPTVTSSIYC
jgi:hypothetical protein